jgi:hypothetical protein
MTTQIVTPSNATLPRVSGFRQEIFSLDKRVRVTVVDKFNGTRITIARKTRRGSYQVIETNLRQLPFERAVFLAKTIVGAARVAA